MTHIKPPRRWQYCPVPDPTEALVQRRDDISCLRHGQPRLSRVVAAAMPPSWSKGVPHPASPGPGAYPYLEGSRERVPAVADLSRAGRPGSERWQRDSGSKAVVMATCRSECGCHCDDDRSEGPSLTGGTSRRLIRIGR